jgi:cysteinyl-tRNA synthetase, unknown class
MILSCKKDDDVASTEEYKQKMRDFVIGISRYAKAKKSDFIIIPQNGIELVSKDGDDNSLPSTEYLNAIDANGQEDLFYGYDNDNEATPGATVDYLKGFLNLSKNAGKVILVTDYCSGAPKMTDSYKKNHDAGFLSFAADHRELNTIPGFPTPINQENSATVTSIGQVRNFLYLINPELYASKAAFISAVTATNYDLLIMDLYFSDGTAFTASEINQLKSKANGGTRWVVSYMSIGEAENYRYYWNADWNNNKPGWMDSENPDWPGNYKVRYWDPSWQAIIYGTDSSYAGKIVLAGFDGVYLDIIDAFEFYE